MEANNAAAMYTALKDAKKYLAKYCYGDLDALVLVRRIDAALAAPPRNCDRFATFAEAREAHEAICSKYIKCHHGCPLNNEEHYSAFDCFEAWLFAPTEEGGAE